MFGEEGVDCRGEVGTRRASMFAVAGNTKVAGHLDQGHPCGVLRADAQLQ